MRGPSGPLFFFMSYQEISQIIEDFIGSHLVDESHFLVKVSVSSGKVKEGRVQVLIDSDSGITIDECAQYSRLLSQFLEEKDLFEQAYTLEVASPGLDFPLKSERQFRKNIGRRLIVETRDGQNKEGELIEWTPEGLRLVIEEKSKGKKAVRTSLFLPFENIVKAKVTVSFK